MKIQITKDDLMEMAKRCVKLINERTYGGYDEPELEVDPILYNPTTGKFGFMYYTNYSRDLNAYNNALRAGAEDLGDGWVYVCEFKVTDYDYEDTSFGYDIGMDSGIHHEGYYYPTEVKYDGYSDIAYFQNGQQVPDNQLEDEAPELTPEQIAAVEQFANENIDSIEQN